MKRPGSDFLKIKTTKGFLKDLERDKKSKIGDRPFFYKNGTGPKKQNWGQTLFQPPKRDRSENYLFLICHPEPFLRNQVLLHEDKKRVSKNKVFWW